MTGQTLDRIANMMLKMLQATKRETICLVYLDYRALFSVTRVPAVKEIRNQKNKAEILYVHVDKQKAIDYLKERFQFYTKAELEEKMNGYSSDVCGTVQGEP